MGLKMKYVFKECVFTDFISCRLTLFIAKKNAVMKENSDTENEGYSSPEKVICSNGNTVASVKMLRKLKLPAAVHHLSPPTFRKFAFLIMTNAGRHKFNLRHSCY